MSEDAQDVVLIVEDDPSILMVLSAYLAGEGYRVLQAENGEQAFEILASKPHLDLMVTDFRLPGGISGVQIAEPALKLRLRIDPALDLIPEISGNRLIVSVRLMRQEPDGRLNSSTDDAAFELTLCA